MTRGLWGNGHKKQKAGAKFKKGNKLLKGDASHTNRPKWMKNGADHNYPGSGGTKRKMPKKKGVGSHHARIEKKGSIQGGCAPQLLAKKKKGDVEKRAYDRWRRKAGINGAFEKKTTLSLQAAGAKPLVQQGGKSPKTSRQASFHEKGQDQRGGRGRPCP